MLANPLIQEFYEGLVARYPVDGADMTYSQWIMQNTSLNGRPFKFDGYEFQIGILDDMARDMSVIKPSQVGMTEGQSRKFLAFLARNRGTSGIFTLPNEKMYKRVSKTRIRPLIKTTKAFNTSFGDDKPVQSMDLYEIGGSFAYFTGMTEGDATSIPADLLMHDEVDLSDQSMISLFQSRLQNSAYKITQKFSTPTHPAYGIDASFRVSDQHLYLVKCEHCGHHQHPEFTPEFIVVPGFDYEKKLTEIDAADMGHLQIDDAYVQCTKCHRPLNLADPSLREWVPKYPTRRQRGYRISPFSTSRLNVTYIFDQLLKYQANDNMKGFHNTVLGETYSDGSSQLDRQTIMSCMHGEGEPDIGSLKPCAIGIDVGKTCHVTLGPIDGDTLAHPARFWLVPADEIVDFVKELMKEYKIVAGAIDRHPYTPTAEAVMEASGGVIIPVEYRGSKRVNVVEDEFKEISHAQCNRTKAIDTVVKAIRSQLMQIHGYGQYKETVIEHLCDMVRIEVEEIEAKWEKLTGNDHFFHAFVFMLVSLRIKEVVALREDPGTSNMMFGAFPAQKSGFSQPSKFKFGMRTFTDGHQ